MPVDLDQCSEEEREFWLIRKANIRNGGRPRENPLVDHRLVPAESCRRADGTYTKYILERMTDEQRVLFEEFDKMCEDHIVTSWLSVNHRIRFLSGEKFNV